MLIKESSICILNYKELNFHKVQSAVYLQPHFMSLPERNFMYLSSLTLYDRKYIVTFEADAISKITLHTLRFCGEAIYTMRFRLFLESGRLSCLLLSSR